jgi:hypothetical protein
MPLLHLDISKHAPARPGMFAGRSTLHSQVDGGSLELCLCHNGIYGRTTLPDWNVCRGQYLERRLRADVMSCASAKYRCDYAAVPRATSLSGCKEFCLCQIQGVITRQYLERRLRADVRSSASAKYRV